MPPPLEIPIDVTPGGPTANSYATVAEADLYNSTRPQGGAWTGADSAKEGALKWAALLLDASFVWTGSASTDTQNLCWPRTGMLTRNGFPIDPAVIPDDLKYAQCEYARQLMVTDLTATNDVAVQGITSVKAGSVGVTFNKNRTQAEEVALMHSNYDYLTKNIPDAVRLLLVPSWYTQQQVLISDPKMLQPFYLTVDR